MEKQMRTGFKTAGVIMVLVMTLFLKQEAFAMNCKNTGSRCISEGEKVIDGFKVNRCWKYEDSFECKYPSRDNCKPLRDEGCLHVTHDKDGNEVDACEKEHQGKCLDYKKNYVCEREVEVDEVHERVHLKNQNKKKKITCKGNKRLCLDGSCAAQEDDEALQKQNAKDMLNAITQMTSAYEMAKDQVRSGDDTKIVSVFKGEPKRCNKNPLLGFKDCCGKKPKGKGWGIGIGLTRCTSDALAMIKRRAAGHCINLGTYCANKMPLTGICLLKKHTYCCFRGKLQKIIQNQGRANQLGIGFGSAKYPNCRGMTVEEIPKLKFDQIEFKDYYNDVLKKYKTPNVKQSAKRVSEAFANIAKDFSRGSEKDLKNKTNQIPFRNKNFKSEVRDEKGNIVTRPHM